MADRHIRFDSPPHLPPLCVAPILEYYDVSTKRLAVEYQQVAPVDDRSVVDIFKTVQLALSLVDDSYIWPRAQPQPDVHHFVWEREKYHPRHFNGSNVPRDYRDKVSFHKGYLPRQLHEFIHAVIAPPPVPEFSVMEARLRDYEIALELFQSARGAVTARRRPNRIAGVPTCPGTGRVLLDDEILLQITNNFEGYFETSKQLYAPDNEFIVDPDLIDKDLELVAAELGKIAAQGAVNLMPMVYRNRRSSKQVA